MHCLYRWLSTDFTYCSVISFVDFEQVNTLSLLSIIGFSQSTVISTLIWKQIYWTQTVWLHKKKSDSFFKTSKFQNYRGAPKNYFIYLRKYPILLISIQRKNRSSLSCHPLTITLKYVAFYGTKIGTTSVWKFRKNCKKLKFRKILKDIWQSPKCTSVTPTA